MIIGVLTVLRFAKGAGDPPYGLDASYYFQLARHVANGDGFVTTVSLYYEGWQLPARTPIYPLWPLLLGYIGRAIGLVNAADLLPRTFYVVDLALLYLVAYRVALRMGALWPIRRWWMPDTAHWIVAIFGLAPRWFGATTHPYTEGLAFFCAFASFLALERFDRTRTTLAAALAGLFAALAYLARTQMVGIAIGSFVAVVWFALRDRSARRGAIVWSVVALATITPWLLFVGHIPGVTPNRMPHVEIPSASHWTHQATFGEWLGARAEASRVMFDPSSAYSYVQSFGVVAYLVPLAGIAALFRLSRLRSKPQSIFRTAMLVAGLFFFFNLMLYQPEVFLPWLFGWRHGLPFIFLVILAVPWLIARAGRLAPTVVVVLLLSITMNASAVAAFIRAPDPQLNAGEAGLVQWLDAQPRPASVMITNAQILGSMSDAYLYWTSCDATGETTRTMLRLQRIEFIALRESELRCRFATEAGPMRLVRVFSTPGQRLFLLRPLS